MDKRVKSIYTALSECKVIAVDNNLKSLLSKIYGRAVTHAEYMKAYRSKTNPFEIDIEGKIFVINLFENKNPQP
ncbi:hypothetical protein [Chryseobacterium taichungense]|uniref:hypothetical protein n=1 Tax=Chryseobacterium taichungense TaxID=295069 RepID=UPI0028A59180|nr:hypothetical protein [Chryseobacterium taichungense]